MFDDLSPARVAAFRALAVGLAGLVVTVHVGIAAGALAALFSVLCAAWLAVIVGLYAYAQRQRPGRFALPWVVGFGASLTAIANLAYAAEGGGEAGARAAFALLTDEDALAGALWLAASVATAAHMASIPLLTWRSMAPVMALDAAVATAILVRKEELAPRLLLAPLFGSAVIAVAIVPAVFFLVVFAIGDRAAHRGRPEAP